MHPVRTLADLDSGIIKLIVFLVLIVFYLIKVGKGYFKERAEEERRQAPAQPKRAPETGTAASAPPKETAASAPAKETAATEVDRFLEELARQSGTPVPPRPPAPPRPRPPVTAPPPKAPAPSPEARLRAPVAAHRAPTAAPQSAGATMAEAMALPAESEPVAALPAMTHLSPLAQAIVLREILGPCRWFRPYRILKW
jgi:hypothetical protein